MRKRDTRMVVISTKTLRYLNEHAIYFLVKHDIPTLDTEWTLRLFQHSLNNSPFCPPVIAAFTNILKWDCPVVTDIVQEKSRQSQPSSYIDFIVLHVSAYVQSHFQARKSTEHPRRSSSLTQTDSYIRNYHGILKHSIIFNWNALKHVEHGIVLHIHFVINNFGSFCDT